MTSHTIYMWYPIHYIYDILSTMYDNTTVCIVDTTLGICVISFALQMTSHPLYHTKPQYLSCHIHFRHDITAPVSDIAPNVSFSFQRLHCFHTHHCICCHKKWQHTHYICDIICSIYDIISTAFMTSDLLCMRSHAQFITSHPLYLWHHSHYIGNITPTMSVNTYHLYLTWNTLC